MSKIHIVVDTDDSTVDVLPSRELDSIIDIRQMLDVDKNDTETSVFYRVFVGKPGGVMKTRLTEAPFISCKGAFKAALEFQANHPSAAVYVKRYTEMTNSFVIFGIQEIRAAAEAALNAGEVKLLSKKALLAREYGGISDENDQEPEEDEETTPSYTLTEATQEIAAILNSDVYSRIETSHVELDIELGRNVEKKELRLQIDGAVTPEQLMRVAAIMDRIKDEKWPPD